MSMWGTIVDWRGARDMLPIPVWEHTSLTILWVLAVEIDERQATRTSARVCRACGGSGEAIVDIRRVGQRVWSVGQCHDHDLDLHGIEVADGGEGYVIPRNFAVATQPCSCDGPTRPDTVWLHRVVANLAELPRPRFAWPEHWHALSDEAQQRGDWIGRWWQAFSEWTLAGKLPDARALGADLEALTHELEARALEKLRRLKCPTCADAKPGRCCSCSAEIRDENLELGSDPYADEILDDDTLHLQCEGCIEESCQDI